jgi:hypothetical protein
MTCVCFKLTPILRDFPQSLLVCFIALSVFVLVQTGYPQQGPANRTPQSKSVRKRSAPSAPIIGRHQPFVDRQMSTLRRIFLKYDYYEPPRFIWSNDEIWQDLFKNRADLRLSLKKEPNSDKLNDVWFTQFQMEYEVLSLLASNQLDFLSFELGLNDGQVVGLERIVRSDLRQKHQILRTLPASQTSDTYLDRVAETSRKTDVRFQRLLFDEQLKSYQRIKLNAMPESTGQHKFNRLFLPAMDWVRGIAGV